MAVHFVAGLPRSGSTLLMNLLAQNRRHHVTPTSGLLDMVVGVRAIWENNQAFRAQGLPQIEPRIQSLIRGMIEGFFAPELCANRVVFDKNRGWLAYTAALEVIFEHPVPVIVTVRDVKAVVASFERLHQASSTTLTKTPEDRVRAHLGLGGVVGIAIQYIRDCITQGHGDRMVVVRYNDLVTHPQRTLDRLHTDLGLPRFEYNPWHVEQVTREDDSVYGAWGPDLHTIRPVVAPSEPEPWREMIPEDVCTWIDQEYADINRLAQQESP